MAALVEATSVSEFEQFLQDAGAGLVVVHFWASWAPQCEQMNDVLSELSKDTRYVHCKFVKVEAEGVPEVSQKYEISAVPTCILIRNQSVVERVNGAHVPELTKKVEQHNSATRASIPPPVTTTKHDLNTRLKTLINMAPIMLFMKGTADEPRCGFSRQMIQILNEQSAKFSTFNILADEEVRQGLKKFSDWPTYPQLYIEGDLVGGLDIVKEMVENGELADTLPKQQSLDDRLKALTSKETVMLFMKGSPSEPQCGFSKKTVALLAETGQKYGHFDILQDEEVRQGLKTLSNWPTYPQLYVSGELIGGLDILQELQETGDLVSTLKGE